MSILKSFEILIRGKQRTPDETPKEVLVYPILGNPKHPEWFESYIVEDKETLECLGFVGRLGMSRTWEWEDGYSSKGHGRAKSRDEAALRLLKWADR